MLTLAIGVLAGLIVGLARPPAGMHTVRPRVEQIGLLAVGAGLNALSVLLDGTAALVALVLSLAVLIAVAVANRHITGVAVVGVGLMLNLVAVAVNGGMPVRAERPGGGRCGRRGRADRREDPATSRPPTIRCPCSATCCRCRSPTRWCPSATSS